MELPEAVLVCLVSVVVLGAVVADVYLLDWIGRKLGDSRFGRRGDCR